MCIVRTLPGAFSKSHGTRTGGHPESKGETPPPPTPLSRAPAALHFERGVKDSNAPAPG